MVRIGYDRISKYENYWENRLLKILTIRYVAIIQRQFCTASIQINFDLQVVF